MARTHIGLPSKRLGAQHVVWVGLCWSLAGRHCLVGPAAFIEAARSGLWTLALVFPVGLV